MMGRFFHKRALRLRQYAALDGAGDAGGIVTFVGTPRMDAGTRKVSALFYEAYEPMAEAMLEELIFEAKVRWTLVNVVLKHRLGRVPLGQASVLVQVSAPHRGDAFAAAQFLMDRIKKDIPIWKKEIYEDGNGRWVRCDHAAHGRGHGSAEATERIPLDDLL